METKRMWKTVISLKMETNINTNSIWSPIMGINSLNSAKPSKISMVIHPSKLGHIRITKPTTECNLLKKTFSIKNKAWVMRNCPPNKICNQ